MSDGNSSSSGIGFIGLLQIVFITLKLTGHITWPWWCVLLPTLIPLGATLAFLLVMVFMAIVSAVLIWWVGK